MIEKINIINNAPEPADSDYSIKCQMKISSISKEWNLMLKVLKKIEYI